MLEILHTVQCVCMWHIVTSMFTVNTDLKLSIFVGVSVTKPLLPTNHALYIPITRNSLSTSPRPPPSSATPRPTIISLHQSFQETCYSRQYLS